MRYLTLPAYAASDIALQCAKSIKDKKLSNGLAVVVTKIGEEEKNYIALGQKEALFTMTRTEQIGGLAVDEMKRVYKDTFAKSKRTRHIYDAIKKISPNDICPMCGQRTVATLDHYLPQSRHAALIIVPANLVPSCMDCNKTKKDFQPISANEQTFHPYFDNLDGDVWLRASVEVGEPAALLYEARPPVNWSESRIARVHLHFKTFGLRALYASHSAVELTNIRYGLQRIAERGTPEDVQQELLRRADSARAAQINSWQTAMYDALASSDWFCAEGFG
jgi:hypothetical protein